MSLSVAPPPRLPSPQLVPSPLPSPPPIPRRISSRSRLQLPPHPHQPPIPPSLVGSPLLDKLVHPDPTTLTPKIQKQLWFDGDEFGTRSSPHTSPTSASVPWPDAPSPRSANPAHRRLHRPSTHSLAARARSRSPPPPPQLSPLLVPPVPPVPPSIFDNSALRRPVLRTPPSTPSRASHMNIPDAPVPFRARASPSPRRRALGCH